MLQTRPSRSSPMSSRFWRHFISNGGTDPVPGVPVPEPDEQQALDAYSSVVVRVAEQLRPPVVNLRGGRREGSGSGVLFTPDGFLLTNHHVVRGMSEIRVRLSSGEEQPGRLVCASAWTDLSSSHVPAGRLPHAT